MDKTYYFDGQYYEMRVPIPYFVLYFSFGFSSSGESLVYMFTAGAVFMKRSLMTVTGSVRAGRKRSLSI